MAKLHSYEESADKSGYYLKGWTPETGNTTIQVQRICDDLLDWLGFSPGDQLPQDLLNGLLDVGLLYTGNPEIPSENVPDEFDFETDVRNVLTQKQYNKLIGFAESYDNTKIDELISRLNAQAVTVDSEHIPDTTRSEPSNSVGPSEVDHGRFDKIVQDVYEEGNQSDLPDCLSRLDIPKATGEDSVIDPVIHYHHNHHSVSSARTDETTLDYATRLPTVDSVNDSTGPTCGVRFDLTTGEVAVIETITSYNDPSCTPDYGDRGIQHRVDFEDDNAVEWRTVIPNDFDNPVRTDRGLLLEHQVQVLRMMSTFTQRHRGTPISGLIKPVTNGGYLASADTEPSVWKHSEILGELLNPTTNGEKATGTVVFFNDTGGYGFIDTPEHDDDVFYHMEDVGGPDITEGERVAFEIVQADEGPRATEVERLS